MPAIFAGGIQTVKNKTQLETEHKLFLALFQIIIILLKEHQETKLSDNDV